ncbi:MAG: hypothetical protein HQM14_09710 [SAR324 cluster bacterium]|nr:hypothetical protein [SAR324 cluster bacterium]
MGLLVFIGSLLIFANVMNPDINTNTLQAEVSRYQLQDTVRIKQKNHVVASFISDGVEGVGITSLTSHRDFKNWLGTLNLRYYRGSDFRLTFYTAGIDYIAIRPNSPIRLSVGAEGGIGDLDVDRLDRYGRLPDATGWEIHSALQSHFVMFDHLWNYYLRPTLRVYQFEFDGKPGIRNKIINGQGFALAAGLGMRF